MTAVAESRAWSSSEFAERIEWGVVYPNGRVLVFSSRAGAESEADRLAMGGVRARVMTRTLRVGSWVDPVASPSS